jgi:hypothetical protein
MAANGICIESVSDFNADPDTDPASDPEGSYR